MELDKSIDGLQVALAQVDLFTRQSSGSGFIEFLVIKKQNLKVKMYKEDGHSKPHIHIDYGSSNHAASYAISDGRRLAGSLHNKYERTIVDWLSENRESLLKLWNKTQSSKPIDELVLAIRKA